MSLSAGTFAKVIEDVVDSLARSGFSAFYFLNGHGANVAPIRCADYRRFVGEAGPMRSRATMHDGAR